MSYSVGQLATLAGVSVRTLHHYDRIGLLSPADRSSAGYRRYGDADLRRLQQILFYRELGFALSGITDLISDPDAEPAEHLGRQHALLAARLERTGRLIEAVERAMEAEKLGIALTPEERLEVSGEHDPGQYADEVTSRWGGTDAYRQARQRTKSYWFAANYESVAPGLAAYVRDAIVANASGRE